MEMIPALFATMAEAGTAAAGTAGASAGLASAAAAGGTSLSLMNLINGVATAGSILSGVMGGKAQSQQLETQARMAEIDAGQQAVESERRANDIRRKALQAQASNAVAFAASGIDGTIGTPADINAGIASDALYQTETERQNAERQRLRGRIAAAGYRTAAGNAEAGGMLNGLLQGSKFALSLANRG